MKLSIVIPSFNRSKLLRWGLTSWARQRIPYSYEIIILNDYLSNDGTKEICEEFKDKLNIRYIFTGQRNSPGNIKWRIPGFAHNIGVKQAKGEFIILTNPEIYLIENNIIIQTLKILLKKPKTLVIPNGTDDIKREYLNKLEIGGEIDITIYNHFYHVLHTEMPFFMGIRKKDFISIGGYDEDFIGFAYDDSDFVERMKANNYKYHQISSHIIHLNHSRRQKDRNGLENYQKQYRYNKDLYYKRQGIIVRNVNKEWGKLDSFKVLKSAVEYQKEIEEYRNKQISLIEKTCPLKWELKRIPKIAHFYWGEEKLPFLRYLTIASFIKYNPDWEVRLYYPKYRQSKKEWATKENCYKVKIKKDYYDKLKNLPVTFVEVDFTTLDLSNDLPEIHKSDYLRWFLLANIGGMWSDMDIIYIDSMYNLSLNTPKNKKLDTLICYHKPWKHSIGFLLSSENNQYYKYLWKSALKRKYNPQQYQTVGSLVMNSNDMTPDKMHSEFPLIKIGNITMDTVYPYTCASSSLKKLHSDNLDCISQQTIGLHWYAGATEAQEFVNNITEKNYKEINNVVAKVTDMSLNNKRKKKSLTIQAVVKNEAFIYYSIKSVYDYADKILLYDTGSNDKHTLEDINKLLEEDTEHKITFKQIPLGFDEEKWSWDNLKEFIKENKGKMSVGKVRQIQLEDTDTEFFMIVDGDEVHYKETMEKIVNNILPNLNKDIVGVNIPLMWFCDMEHTFALNGTGRIWRTDKVVMNDVSPNEAHCYKDTGIAVTVEDKQYLIYPKNMITPYAHFETFIKPWRRTPKNIVEFKGKLPEVMKENPYYIERYLKEKAEKMKKEILITGGCGFIGSHLVEKLIKNVNYNITIIDDLSTGNVKNIKPYLKEIKLYKNRIQDLKIKTKFDIIYHLAAKANTREKGMKDYIDNVMATEAVVKLLKPDGHIYFSSSCAVYGNQPVVNETSIFQPISPYGYSKWMNEFTIKNNCKNYTIFRFSNVFGERQDGSNEMGLIGVIDYHLKKNKTMTVFNKGENSRDFIYVKDVIEALTTIDKKDIFQIGQFKTYKTLDLVKLSNVKWKYGKCNSEVDSIKLDNTKIKKEGWKPTLEVTEYIKRLKK